MKPVKVRDVMIDEDLNIEVNPRPQYIKRMLLDVIEQEKEKDMEPKR